MTERQKLQSCGFACGIMSGFGQSALFNTYDRALYHSIVNRRSFLDPQNWKGNPFTGVSPSFLQRSFSAGLYFPLEEFFRVNVTSNLAIDGLLVGLFGGILTTPFNSVKYAMWSHTPQHTSADTTPSLGSTARNLFHEGGLSRLMRGVVPTLYRDMTFGVTFSLLRHKGDNGFGINSGAAFLATALSSPFNYARMKTYGRLPGEPTRSTRTILMDWRGEVLAQADWGKRFRYVVYSLNMGWGALRVGLGMGIGSQIFNACAALC